MASARRCRSWGTRGISAVQAGLRRTASRRAEPCPPCHAPQSRPAIRRPRSTRAPQINGLTGATPPCRPMLPTDRSEENPPPNEKSIAPDPAPRPAHSRYRPRDRKRRPVLFQIPTSRSKTATSASKTAISAFRMPTARSKMPTRPIRIGDVAVANRGLRIQNRELGIRHPGRRIGTTPCLVRHAARAPGNRAPMSAHASCRALQVPTPSRTVASAASPIIRPPRRHPVIHCADVARGPLLNRLFHGRAEAAARERRAPDVIMPG